MVDVARYADVSIKTVSRVLNNEPHVQEKLRTRVLEAVKELGYVPSATARSLRSNRSYNIHMVAHTIRSNFINALQAGALSATQNQGYRLITTMLDAATVADEDNFNKWCLELMRTGKPDGLILVPPYSNNPYVNEIINRHGIAIARIGPNKIDDHNTTIMIDDRSAAQDATNHLINLGHQRIAFVRGIEEQESTHERFKGYRDALEAAGLDYDEKLTMPGAFSFQSGFNAGEKLLNLGNPPSAVFTANDEMAAGVLVSAHTLGIPVPEKLSVIGFDDSEIAETMWPPLTTIRQPLIEFGESAVQNLIAIAEKPKKERVAKIETLNYEMVMRQSTASI